MIVDDPLLPALVQDLSARHGCHTVILYGSRALGTATAESDYDMLGVRTTGEATRDARGVEGNFLDAFIYPEEGLLARAPSLLQLRGGVVLREERGLGARLLSAVADALAAPPEPLPEAEVQRVWCRKMLARLRRGGPGDVEAHYRRVWLLTDVLELFFRLRGRHYLGPKESFRWLAENDPADYRLFAEALAPGAPLEAVEALVERVLSA